MPLADYNRPLSPPAPIPSAGQPGRHLSSPPPSLPAEPPRQHMTCSPCTRKRQLLFRRGKLRSHRAPSGLQARTRLRSPDRKWGRPARRARGGSRARARRGPQKSSTPQAGLARARRSPCGPGARQATDGRGGLGKRTGGSRRCGRKAMEDLRWKEVRTGDRLGGRGRLARGRANDACREGRGGAVAAGL